MRTVYKTEKKYSYNLPIFSCCSAAILYTVMWKERRIESEYINLYDLRGWLEMALVSCPTDTLKTLPTSINETKLTL